MKAVGLSQFNTSSIDLYIAPALNRHNDGLFNMSLVNFTWKVTSFDETILEFKLNFTSPAQISPLAVQDSLVLDFR